MALLDSVKKKSTQTNLIKFNHDKTVSIKKAEVTRSIIVDDKEGFLARNSAFTEFSEDKLFTKCSVPFSQKVTVYFPLCDLIIITVFYDFFLHFLLVMIAHQ